MHALTDRQHAALRESGAYLCRCYGNVARVRDPSCLEQCLRCGLRIHRRHDVEIVIARHTQRIREHFAMRKREEGL